MEDGEMRRTGQQGRAPFLEAKRSVSLRKEKSPVSCCSETEMKTEPSSEFGRVRVIGARSAMTGTEVFPETFKREWQGHLWGGGKWGTKMI